MKKAILSIIILTNIIIFSKATFSQIYTPGNIYYDSTGYVEYRAGNLPIIISAPHGGSLEPYSIPDRDCSGCSYVKDAWTIPIAEGMYDAFIEQTGCYPHVIINLLHRKKFDANRDIDDAADGNQTVEQAWYGYHELIDSAKARVIQDYGRGIFLDIHGHGHAIQRIELGYLLSRAELQLSDSILNMVSFFEESSIRTLVGDNIQSLSHSELLRGQNSFGTLLNNKGFPSVPSFSDPFPQNSESYFSGGYNTQRHGSRDNAGEIDAIQLELNQDIRFNYATREIFIDSLTTSVIQYINYQYNNQFADNFCNLISDISEPNYPEYGFKIHPNPNEGYFNIESEINEIEIQIYNCLGQNVYSEIWSGSKIEIDFLQSGYYIVQLKKDNLILGSMKLVKN